MIIVKMMGGLGNQLFQYAYALSLAKEYNEEILFDTSAYPEEHQLTIYKFNVPKHRNWEEVFGPEERAKIVKEQKKYRVLQKAKRVLLRTEELGNAWFKKNMGKGHYFNFDPYYYPMQKTEKTNKYIYGYFQSEKYFENCKELISELYTFPVPLSQKAEEIKNLIKEENSVAIHIRLGDYKKLRNHYLDVCTQKYYKNAMEYIAQNEETPRFFVFTNDAEEVKKIVRLPENAIIVEGTKDYEDFELIRECKHAIISNSTFSWWAAYLNDNTNKRVVAPTPWFTTLKKEADIYWNEMIKLEV